MAMRWQPALRTRAALSRRSRLYRCAGATRSRAPPRRRSISSPRSVLASLPRAAEDLSRQGRSLPLPLPEDGAAAARAARLAEGEAAASPSSRASAGRNGCKPYTDETVEELAQERRQAPRRHQPRLRCRLRRNAGGDRRGRTATIFLEHGGEHFAALPCLNDSEESIGAPRADSPAANSPAGYDAAGHAGRFASATEIRKAPASFAQEGRPMDVFGINATILVLVVLVVLVLAAGDQDGAAGLQLHDRALRPLHRAR